MNNYSIRLCGTKYEIRIWKFKAWKKRSPIEFIKWHS